jgi:prepilin-type N-terminal cleavage/methylation domain-containing protein
MISRLRDDRGFSLVELLVTMSLLSVVMALITGSAIFLQRSLNATDQRLGDLAQARLAMDASTKWLRSAVTVGRTDTTEDTQPFTQASRTSVDFMANVGLSGAPGVPQRVELRVVNGNELREQVWRGVITAGGEWQPSGTSRTRIVARGLTDPALFTFFDAAGTELTPTGTANMTVVDRARIRRVGIAINVQRVPAPNVPQSQLRNRLTLPNQYYFDAERSS